MRVISTLFLIFFLFCTFNTYAEISLPLIQAEKSCFNGPFETHEKWVAMLAERKSKKKNLIKKFF